jgi:hypothetical protein
LRAILLRDRAERAGVGAREAGEGIAIDVHEGGHSRGENVHPPDLNGRRKRGCGVFRRGLGAA